MLRTTSPTVVSLAILFEAPGAALIAAVWLHQLPPASVPPGIVVLLVGLAIVIRPGPARCRSSDRLNGAMRTLRAPAGPVLAVPGSSPKMLDKAQGLPVDEVFLDLEDAVARRGQAGGPGERRRRAQRGRLGAARPARSG